MDNNGGGYRYVTRVQGYKEGILRYEELKEVMHNVSEGQRATNEFVLTLIKNVTDGTIKVSK